MEKITAVDPWKRLEETYLRGLFPASDTSSSVIHLSLMSMLLWSLKEILTSEPAVGDKEIVKAT